jgi:hypothetical protein
MVTVMNSDRQKEKLLYMIQDLKMFAPSGKSLGASLNVSQ